MKKITQLVTTVFMAVLILSIGTIDAQTVNFDDSGWPTKATSIDGLVVDGTTYVVSFLPGPSQEAVHAYGPFPGVFTFNGESEGTAAAIALDDALNAAGATHIGDIASLPERGFELFHIGYGSIDHGDPLFDEVQMSWGSHEPAPWSNGLEDKLYHWDARNWAIFTTDLGVNDDVFESSISIYPNPADNYINLKTEAYIKSIYISDVTGKVVKHLRFEEGEARTLDVSMLRAGLYFLKLEDDKGQMAIKKIIIQ